MIEQLEKLFIDLPALLTTEQVAKLTHTSRKTIYDWQYRPAVYRIPDGMLFKFGRKLLIRKDILLGWIAARGKDKHNVAA